MIWTLKTPPGGFEAFFQWAKSFITHGLKHIVIIDVKHVSVSLIIQDNLCVIKTKTTLNRIFFVVSKGVV